MEPEWNNSPEHDDCVILGLRNQDKKNLCIKIKEIYKSIICKKKETKCKNCTDSKKCQ